MSTRQKLDPPNIVDTIRANADVVRQAINHLNERIRRFSDYLSKLDGRTEAICYLTHPDYPEEGGCGKCLALKLHREGKAWILSWAAEDLEDAEFLAEWKPLLEAPLRYKLLLVAGFADLLQSIANTNHKLESEITTAVEAYDEFEAALPKMEGK